MSIDGEVKAVKSIFEPPSDQSPASLPTPFARPILGKKAKMMAEDVKWGLAAEMIHDRSFEESPDYLGLPAGWRLEPDERNDNVGAIKFTQTTDESYPRVNRATGGPMSSIAPSSSSNSATATSAPGANSGKADSCLFSSPQSRNEVREVRFPSDAGIIGRVVAVSMSIADMKQCASE